MAKGLGELAVLGGAPEIPEYPEDLFRWPSVTEEDEQAVLEVIRAGSMSESNITRQFEAEYTACRGTTHALAFCNGTASILAAMYVQAATT